MTNEEQNALRTMIREVVREEVNAAVYASEQRLGDRLKVLDDRVGLIGIAQREMQNELVLLRADLTETVAVLDQATIQINDLQASQRALEIKLDESVVAIRRDQGALEKTFEENVAELRQEMQRQTTELRQEMQRQTTELRQEMQKQTLTMTNFARQFVDLNGRTNARIDLHERTPVDQAHPHSAA